MEFKAGDVVVILPGFERTMRTLCVVIYYDQKTRIAKLDDKNLYFTYKLIPAINLSKLEKILFNIT